MKTIMFFIFSLFFIGGENLTVEHHGFLADGKGQFFVLKPDGIDLINPEGKLLRHHSEKLLGHIGSVDRTSFMRLMVFYDEVPGYQLLDNTLSPHSDLVDLNVMGRPFISLMCTSSNNSYWLYDKVSFELVRMNDKNREISNSGNLMNVIGSRIDPFKIAEAGNRLYMADKDQGLLVFDQFGVFMSQIELKDILDFSVEIEEQVYILQETGISHYISKPWSLTELPMDVPAGAKHLDVDEGNIYIGTGKQIWTYDR